MSPFLWGLAGKKFESEEFYSLWMEQKYNRGPLMMLEVFRIIVAVFFVGSLFYQLFSGGIFVIIAMTIMIIIVIIFSTKLRDFYFRIEQRFLENLNAREAEKPLHPAIEMLPWDVHIAEFIISPECSLVGISLIDLRLREKYGINIGAIERGKIRINIPSKNEKLYPGDNISVIGTDEALENFKQLLNTSEVQVTENSNSYDEITLQQFIISSKSPLLGKSIREAGIHEKLFALVIGLERRGERISNPESTIRFERGDVVWIVGENNIFRKLLKSME
jgi:CPA2 family monovalent cation:H+ antiporter-2